MNNFVGRMISLELGILSLTRDKVKGVVDELIDRGDLGQEEGKKLVDELIERGEKNKSEIRLQIEKLLADAMRSQDLPTRREIGELRADIIQLRRDLDRLMLEEKFERKRM